MKNTMDIVMDNAMDILKKCIHMYIIYIPKIPWLSIYKVNVKG